MYSEAVPWRYHLRFVSDYLTLLHKFSVFDIISMNKKSTLRHLTPFAMTVDRELIYALTESSFD
jgi:hypothetical protein